MNIFIISHGIPSKEDPQWGCFELDQAKALSRLGHHVIMVTVDGRFRRWLRWPGIHSAHVEGIDTYLYFLFPFKVLHYPVLTRKARKWMMTSLFEYVCRKRGTPDVIYAHYMFVIGALGGVKKKYPYLPIVGIEHWSVLSRTELDFDTRTRGEIAYKLVDRLLAVSPGLQEKIKLHFGKRSDVVYDMVSEAFLEAKLFSGPDVDTPFVFVSCGSLIPGKGFDVLFRAFSRIEDKTSRLIILGAGPEYSNLLELTESLGVSTRVDFVGMVPREKIVDVYNHCSAFVLASRSETFGVSYVEAMAMGIPVIATRCGGPEYFVTDKCGFLLEPNDEDQLTAAMNRMQKEYDRFNPVAIREYIRSRFSGEEIAKQLELIFEEEIQKKKQ